MNCPACNDNGALQNLGTEVREAMQCASCGGLWLTRTAFNATSMDPLLAETLSSLDGGAPAGPSGPVHYRTCPACSEHMGRRQYGRSGVVLDICHKHGFWFDKGELRKVLSHAQEEGGTRTAPLAADIGSVNAPLRPLNIGDGWMDGNPALRFKPFLRTLLNALKSR